MMDLPEALTGKDVALRAFDSLFQKAAAKLHVECSEEDQREAKRDFAERSAAMLELLNGINVPSFPDEVMHSMEQSMDRLSPSQLVGYLAALPLAVQAQEILRQMSHQAAEQSVMNSLIAQADDTFGGN